MGAQTPASILRWPAAYDAAMAGVSATAGASSTSRSSRSRVSSFDRAVRRELRDAGAAEPELRGVQMQLADELVAEPLDRHRGRRHVVALPPLGELRRRRQQPVDQLGPHRVVEVRRHPGP